MSRKKSGRTENQGAPRLGFNAYNISRERYIELRNGCAAGKYSRETLREACRGLEFIEPWIILSVTKSRSYDLIEFDFKLERIPIGRSDFYGFRRKFYHNQPGKDRYSMKLKSERVLELMEQRGITEDMLHDICGVHYIRDNCMISQCHARRLSEVLGVDVSEIAEQLGEGGKA